ncbi:MAG: hypothetical protein NT014_01125 [Candidatus Omnitrophica bacterium]|nr:hypothetical protein [Candidatus Omnitrophota bacterium]
MGIRKLIKRIGRSVFSLKQDDDAAIAQSVLITDDGHSRLADLTTAIKKIKNYFPKSKITVLTFIERSSSLQNEFSGLEFIICAQGIRPRRYRIALQLLFLSRKKYDYLVNFSLDISPLIVQLLLFKAKIILYNQWGQWCSLRLRKVSEIFKRSYSKPKSKNSLKNCLKRIGLFFILLKTDDEEVFSHNILIIDDGLVAGQFIYASRRIKEDLPYARIIVLTALKRKEPEEERAINEIIRADKFWIKKYRLPRHMLKLKNNNYDYVVLLSLAVTPVIISVLFMKGRVLLNNRWHQWWRINFKPARYYLMLIPRLISGFIIKIAILIYLLINVFWIFLMRAVTGFKINLLTERD